MYSHHIYSTILDYSHMYVFILTCPPYTQAHPAGAVVVSSGSAVATRANSGPVSGVGNVGIRRAEIKQGR